MPTYDWLLVFLIIFAPITVFSSIIIGFRIGGGEWPWQNLPKRRMIHYKISDATEPIKKKKEE